MTVTSPPTVEQLAQALELLGRPVTVSPNAPTAPAALHLTRVLVALAEQHAIAAERAAAEADTNPADVEVSAYQDTYDKATTGGALELLVLAYWRAQRLTAGVKALRAQLTRTETETERTGKPSALAVVWDLIGPAAAAVEGLLGMEAHLTVTDDSKAMVAQLDAATGLLVHLGGKAGRLRAHIGLDFNPPEGKAVDPNSVSVVAGPTGPPSPAELATPEAGRERLGVAERAPAAKPRLRGPPKPRVITAMHPSSCGRAAAIPPPPVLPLGRWMPMWYPPMATSSSARDPVMRFSAVRT